MRNFQEGLPKAIEMLSLYAVKLANDGLTVDDFDEIDDCLDGLKELVQSGREQLEKAYEDAGGLDSASDKNRAEKISTDNVVDYVNKLEI